MGDFHTAISSLLQAFSNGIAVLKRRRKGHRSLQSQAHTSSITLEKDLCESLRKSRLDVRQSYEGHRKRVGEGFRRGDAESLTTLSAILARLNTALVAVIERFLSGRTTTHDYATLLDLSQSSRAETLRTLDGLSRRLSRSQLALHETNDRKRSRTSHVNHGSKACGGRKRRSKKTAPSEPEIRVSSSLAATSTGWVRPKPHRQRSGSSTTTSASGSGSPSSRTTKSPPITTSPSTSPSTHKRPISTPHRSIPVPVQRRGTTTPPQNPERKLPSASPSPSRPPHPIQRRAPPDRHSIYSWASDSTKIGEIPMRKWAYLPILHEQTTNTGGIDVLQWPIEPAFPLKGAYMETPPLARKKGGGGVWGRMRMFGRKRGVVS